jgi:hypothetical protein
MRRYTEVQNPAPVVCQHQKDIQNLKPDGWHEEEVNRNHGLEMVGEKGPPSRRWRIPLADHVLADTGFADVNAGLQKLAVNPRSAPYGVLTAHSANQIPDLPGYGRSAGLPLRTFQVQNSRKLFRCQAITVSGWTMTNAVRQSLHAPTAMPRRGDQQRSASAASPSDARRRAGGEERGPQPEVRHGCGTKPKRLQTTLRIQGRARIDVRGATPTVSTRSELRERQVTAPQWPWQNSYVERLIGSPCWITSLCGTRSRCGGCCEAISLTTRSHHSLSPSERCPSQEPSIDRRTVVSLPFPRVGGLHHRYEWCAAWPDFREGHRTRT